MLPKQGLLVHARELRSHQCMWARLGSALQPAPSLLL